MALEVLLDLAKSTPSAIDNPEMFNEGIRELRAMVGMSRLKDAMAEQFIKLIRTKDSKKKTKLNTVILGPPGTGKSTVCKILAKIWMGLGVIPATPKSCSKKQEVDMDSMAGILTALMILYVLGQVCLYAYGQTRAVGSWMGMRTRYQVILTVVVLALILLVFVSVCRNNEAIREPMINLGKCVGLVDDPKPAPPPPPPGGSPFPTKPVTPASRFNDVVMTTSRDDFVSPYVGDSTRKTKALIRKCRGKVLFVDEAYSLINGREDNYGMDALTQLNLDMTESEGDPVVIFAGYGDLLNKTVFRAQPGLRRRFEWWFTMDAYTPEDLWEIFCSQMKKSTPDVIIENPDKCLKMFHQNAHLFSENGGDTENLVNFVEIKMMIEGGGTKILTPSYLKKGLVILAENKQAAGGPVETDEDRVRKFIEKFS